MASPTTNRGMTYPAHGGGVGTWDSNLNANFELLDLALGGYYSITASSSITVANTFNSSFATIASTAQSITLPTSLAQNLFYNVLGTLQSSLAINMPAAGSIYAFGDSLTTGSSYAVAVQPTGGSAVTLPSGGQAIVVTNSSAAYFAQNAFGAIIAQSLVASSAVVVNGILTQNSSQHEQLPSGPTASRSGAPVAGYFRYNSTLNAIEWWNGTIWAGPGVAPTVQRFTAGGPLTYTPTTGMTRIRVRMCSGGGPGGYTGTGGGAVGGTTSFELWTCIGGSPGVNGSGSHQGGIGGTGGVDGTGLRIVRFPGGGGCSAPSGTTGPGGQGGNNPFGGGGLGNIGAGNGQPGATNTGAGGGAAGGGGNQNGGGGGAGEYVEFWMTAAQIGVGVSYTVGAGGIASGTGVAGGNGAAGIIIIEEFYD